MLAVRLWAKMSLATRCTSSAATCSMPREHLVQTELLSEVQLLPGQVAHAGARALERQHQAALQVVLGPPQLGLGDAVALQPADLLDGEPHDLGHRVEARARVDGEVPGVGVGGEPGGDRVDEAALLPHVLEEARGHAAPEHGIEDVGREAVGVGLRIGGSAQAEVDLLQLLLRAGHDPHRRLGGAAVAPFGRGRLRARRSAAPRARPCLRGSGCRRPRSGCCPRGRRPGRRKRGRRGGTEPRSASCRGSVGPGDGRARRRR